MSSSDNQACQAIISHLEESPTLGENVDNDERKDILNFPIFQFKAKPVKPVEVKPKRVKKVNAVKGKTTTGTDDIKKYFTVPGKSADTQIKPTQQAKPLTQSKSEHQKEGPS